MPEKIRYHQPSPAAIRLAVPADVAEAKRERDAFYGSRRWKDLRESVLRKNPRCAKCLAEGRDELSAVVHHLKDRIEFPKLAYAPSNLEALCKSCHTSHHKAQVNRKRGDRR